MNLGNIIKKIRKQKSQTQSDLAINCGITQTYLSQIERNSKEPSLSILKLISDSLNVPLPILLFLSMTEDDVKPNAREAFKIVSPSIKALVNEFFAV
jgi:transcriptional regulator with XRE-family HTH domain